MLDCPQRDDEIAIQDFYLPLIEKCFICPCSLLYDSNRQATLLNGIYRHTLLDESD